MVSFDLGGRASAVHVEQRGVREDGVNSHGRGVSSDH